MQNTFFYQNHTFSRFFCRYFRLSWALFFFISSNILRGQSDAAAYDILINEFMADPSPTVGLPNSEYIELYNRSNKTLNLAGFRLYNGSVFTELPSFLLKPKAYVTVYTRKSGVDFGIFGDTIPVAKLITLTNPNDVFHLVAPNGNVIDAATYDLGTYQNPKKTDGGWSLERIFPNAPCRQNAFIASTDLRGGTPGKRNSVANDAPDLTPATPLSIFPENDKTLVVRFDKSLDRSLAEQPSNYALDNNARVNSVKISAPLYNSVQINLSSSLVPKRLYKLIVKNSLKDCQGIPLSKNDSLAVQLPEKMAENDVIINEILFNPATGGVRFVELFNNSEKAFDLTALRVADLKTGDVKPVTTPFLLMPKQYAVITENPTDVQQRYNATRYAAQFVKNRLPTWDAKSGNATIYTVEGSKSLTIDAFDYDAAFHNPLLADVEGVSLERIRPDFPTNNIDNWASAAATQRYGTPGYRNSQQRDTNAVSASNDGVFFFENDRFSPDDDGFEDNLVMFYRTKEPNLMATAKIFDANGRLVKQWFTNLTLDAEGFIKWSGENDENQRVNVGIYVIMLEITRPKGQIDREKKTCVVATRF